MSELVEDLELWLDQPAYVDTTARGRELDRASWLIGRARDEIVVLRAMREAHIRMLSANCHEARNDALEEAARVCDEPAKRLREELGWSAEAELLERYAAAIRALKDKKHNE